jgi:hypothetical protein
MHVIETFQDCRDGRYWMRIQDTRGFRDVLAHLLADGYCNHDRGRCLIDPPRWSYWIGGHSRFSLGGLIWRVGQWACNHRDGLAEVYRTEVTRKTLERDFGWEDLAEEA